jgi:phosphate transport system permease protein
VIERLAFRGRSARPIEGFQMLTALVVAVVPLLLTLIVVVVAAQGIPAIQHFGLLDFLRGTTWDPVHKIFGALPFIYGTLVSSLIALLFALPVGVGVALFLAEPGAIRIRGAIGVAVEMLAAVPSVVYGIWGLFVLAPWLLQHIDQPISARLGAIPIFAGPPRGASMFAAGVVLAVMVIPTLASVSRDVIKGVPPGLRENGMAMAATWWETTWKLVLPAARPGIFGATVLALGRALGETMAVAMVIGNRPELGGSIFAPAYTLASVIANEFTEATGRLYQSSLIALGLILIVVTLIVNGSALVLMRLVGHRAKAA